MGINFWPKVYVIDAVQLRSALLDILSRMPQQTTRSNKENRLHLTNDFSIVSKYSAVKNGYFSDKVLEEFIENWLYVKSWRRTPLVNRGYAARLMAVDWIAYRSIQFESVDCFIILGAGYDFLPFHRANQCCWIELDLPKVIDIKSKFIRDTKILPNNAELVELKSGIFSSTLLNYHMIACDFTDTNKLIDSLQFVLSIVKSGKRNVAILNEVCLCYVEVSEIKTILKTIIDSVSSAAFRIHYIGYEQVKPNKTSQFSEVMLNHFSSLGHPLKHLPNSKEVRQLLSNHLGFNHVTVAPMYQIYHNALLSMKLESDGFQHEPFDEFEEMDLYLGHYALVTGVLIIKDPFRDQHNAKKLSIETDELSENLTNIVVDEQNVEINLVKSSIHRFGHASCLLEDKSSDDCSIVISGGFGKLENQDEKHKRLSDCTLVEKVNDQYKVSAMSVDKKFNDLACLDRMHGQLGRVDDGLVFFNGGRQSPVKHSNSNTHFLSHIDKLNNHMTIKHLFELEKTKPVLCWRHKLSKCYGDRMLQIGGINLNFESSPLVIWNLSSSKLGFTQYSCDNLELLNRHSFGMDSRDQDTFIVIGGLQTNPALKDRPVGEEENAVLFDLRSNQPIRLSNMEPAKCYSSHVHFLSDNQLVVIGGISSTTGLYKDTIELIDLRSNGNYSVYRKTIPTTNDFSMLTNATTEQLSNKREIVSFGGGGNYFTFGTCFNQYHTVFEYA